ncbi:hypothetical protein G6F68_016136 [Rhizopus microsporus]|nr:hypothetical protein G6F68_016136 [Rhizopus microsporus]
MDLVSRSNLSKSGSPAVRCSGKSAISGYVYRFGHQLLGVPRSLEYVPSTVSRVWCVMFHSTVGATESRSSLDPSVRPSLLRPVTFSRYSTLLPSSKAPPRSAVTWRRL